MGKTAKSKVAGIFNEYVTGDLVRLVKSNGESDPGYKFVVFENPDAPYSFSRYKDTKPTTSRSYNLWEAVIHDGYFASNIRKGADKRVNTDKEKKGDIIRMIFFKSKSIAKRFLRSQKAFCDLSIGIVELEVIPPQAAYVAPKVLHP